MTWQPARERGLKDNRQTSAQDHFLTVLLAMAAHDLRQPLQVLMGTHRRLERLVTGETEREYLRHAGAAIAQLLDQFDRLVDALRLHERVSSVTALEVPLAPIFTQLGCENLETARTKGIKLRICPTSKVVQSDATLLTAVLRNLVHNALKYTAAGGCVLLGCRTHGSEVSIEVIDTGDGIPADQLSRIFQAFHRLDSTHPDGLGIGLFVVRRIVDLLGHGIEVRSQVGHGSCFAVRARHTPVIRYPLPVIRARDVITVAAPNGG